VNTLTAPSTWQSIEFVSDLHLHEGLPRTFDAFSNYLAQTTADAVLILGDLFEAWVGDDMRHQSFEAQCTDALARAGQRLHLGIMVGNRDFLLGADMLSACHAHHLADPTVLSAFGHKHLLTHGDAWCLNDTAYMALRQQIRAPAWTQPFLARPLAERLAVARDMRASSKAEQNQMLAMADVDASVAQDLMSAHQCESLIHGHTHRPESAIFTTDGKWRHVLSDWDLDGTHGTPNRAQVLRLTASGFARTHLAA